MPANNAGTVYLVGAGPGDPGLLTLRAAELLQRADVLLYDALAADAIVALAPPQCERIFVGKRAARHAMPQADIEALAIERARAGKRVVRLKGGDPFVFGRGGEEAQALRAAGIPFEIVPGISSATAAPAYAGIAVTHREHNTAFTVATGHEDPSKAGSTLDWSKLADPHRTLIFLMAMENLAEIARRLVEAGLDASTPAAVVQDGTRPTQRTVTGTLESIAGDVARAGLSAPAVVVVGSVVTLRSSIAWFDNTPLFGKRVLVTRPATQGLEFARALAGHGMEPILAPTIAIAPPDDAGPAQHALDELERYRWIAFTSRNGVDAFFEALAARGAVARALGGIKVAAIGPATAARLAARGVRADLVPSAFVGEEIARALIAAATPGDRILIYRAQEARDVLPTMLADAGLLPTIVAAYKTTPAADPDFASKVARADVLTFTSPSTVAGFVASARTAADGIAAANAKVVACIGPITAQAARDAGLRVDVAADVFTADGLIDALETHFAVSA